MSRANEFITGSAEISWPEPERREVYEQREGGPTRDNNCQHVRGVPDSLRAEGNPRFQTHNLFYQKYTEACGLPILCKLLLVCMMTRTIVPFR